MSSVVVALKVLHVLIAIGFVSGLIGRAVILRLAARSSEVARLGPRLEASGIFERWLVIPGSMAILVSGILLAWLAGYPVFGFLRGHGPYWVPLAIFAFLTTVPWVPLVFLPRGAVFGAAIEASRKVGRITPELANEFSHPVVRAGHVYEFAVVLVLLFLMVAKPF